MGGGRSPSAESRIKNPHSLNNTNIKEAKDSKISTESTQNIANFEDITIYDIYDCIDSKFKNMLNLELELEAQVLQANEELLKVYKYAQDSNKTIIITSDMYLPIEFLEKILRKNGFEGFYKLYVSSDCRLAKHTGNLYAKIINDFKINPNLILHIGDNIHSDVKMAQSSGLKAIWYEKIYDKFTRQNNRAKLLSNLAQNHLDASILSGIFAIALNNKPLMDYWQDFGYHYAAVLNYAYAKYLADEAKRQNINHILFIARDGYYPKRIFDSFDNGIKTTYIYASRILSKICYPKWNLLDSDSTYEIADLAQVLQYYTKTYRHLFTQNFDTENKDLNYIKDFVKTHQREIEQIQTQEIDNYREYLLDIIDKNDRVAISDSITMLFSSQQFIQKVLDREIYGLYYKVVPYYLMPFLPQSFRFSCFRESSLGFVAEEKQWDFVELLMSAPELPIENLLNKSPLYKANPSPYELDRLAIYPHITLGVDSFVQDVKKIFGEYPIYFSPHIITEYNNIFCTHLDKIDWENIGKIHHASDSNHTIYLPLFKRPPAKNIKLRHKIKREFKRIYSQILHLFKGDKQ